MRKKVSKTLILFLTVILVLGLSACGSGGNNGDTGGGDDSGAATVTWRMANQHPTDSFVTAADLEIIDEIESATEGRVKITLYPDSQLGDYLSVFDELMVGSIEMAHISVNEAYDSRLLGTFLPYLATGYNQLAGIYAPDSYLFQQMHEIEANLGIELMGFFCEGFDGVGTDVELKDAAVIGAEKGALIRVPAMDTFAQCNIRLGFRTSTIPYSDVYTSIQTGIVDGWAGGPANLNYQYFRDVLKYYYDYQQVQEATHIMISKTAFESLLPEDQEAIRSIVQNKCAASIKLAQDDEGKYKDLLREQGITVVEFTDAERAAFADAVRTDVWPKLAKTFTQEFLDGVLASANE
ncbi:TRAP transporter substrate-binding protein DctP [Bacillota bacterium]